MAGLAHDQALLRVQDSAARRFYEIEASREGRAAGELERQITGLLYGGRAAPRHPDL